MADVLLYTLHTLLLIGGAGAAIIAVIFMCFVSMQSYVDQLQKNCRIDRALDDIRQQFERGLITRREYEEWRRIIETTPFAP